MSAHRTGDVRRPPGTRLAPCLCALVCMAAIVPRCGALGAAEPEPTLQFRRVYVPSDRIEELAKGYLPLKQDEFERLVRRMESGGDAQAAGVAVVRAEYSARLEQNQLVSGEAKLEIALQSEEPLGFALDTGRLAIANPMWDEARPRAASLALAADGKSVLFVEKSGRLTFAWTLRGQADALGGVEFDLRLPAGPANRVTLDLPADMAVLLDRGAAFPVQKSNADADGAPSRRRSWILELGGNARAAVRVLPAANLPRQQQLVLVRQAQNYVLAQSGLALSAELRLDVYHEPLRRLQLEVDPGLHVTSARLGDKLLAVTNVAGAEAGMVSIEFPEPLSGADRVLQISAVGPLITGERWKLPTLRVEAAVWQEAALSLATREPLVPLDVVPILCRQTRVSALPAPTPGELWQFQAFSREAGVELQVGRRPERLRLLSGTSITLGKSAVTGVTTAEILALQGEHFDLECETTRLWVIDSVETEPAELLDDWNTVAAGGRRQRLRVRLKRALPAKQSARVVVRAHRQGPASDAALNVEQLRLAEFPGMAESRSLVLVRAETPMRLEIAGDGELTRLDPTRLSSNDAAVLEPNPAGFLFVDDAGAGALQIALQSERPRYAVEAAVAARVDRNSLTESYVVRCRPEASQLTNLVAHFSQAREEKLAWTIPGEEEHEIVSRRLTEDEQRAAGLSGGETWEITMRRPRLAPFELHATRTTPLGGKITLSLASFPEAERQAGTLSIEVDDGSSPLIECKHLRPLPVRSERPGEATNLRGLYRYEPASAEAVSLTPISSGPRPAQAWAWSCRLSSRLAVGRVAHSAWYFLENRGRDEVVFNLPSEAALDQVTVNGNEISVSSFEAEKGRCIVPLPANQRFPIVSLSYSEEGIGLRSWGVFPVALQLPKTDFPVLEQRAALWLPHDVELVPNTAAMSASPSLSWRERLLGPLAAGASSPFDLFSADAWRDKLAGAKQLEPPAGESERALEALGELAIAARASQAANTWRKLLDAYRQIDRPEFEGALPPLLIDPNAAEAAGVAPHSPLPATANSDPREAGRELLTAANLELVVIGGDVMLTSALVPPPGAGEAVTPETWFALALLPTSPWRTARPTPFAELGTQGWRAVAFEVPAAGRREVRLYRPSATRLTAWGALLFVAFFTWLAASRRPRLLIVAAVAAGLAALYAEGLRLPPATASFLGVALAALLVAAWRVGRPLSAAREDASTRTVAAASAAPAAAPLVLLAVATALVALLAFAARLSADDPAPAAGETAAAEIQPVFIPVNEKRVPNLGLVYLPMRFYDALHAQDAATSGAARAWLAHSASYQCELDRAQSGGKLDVITLTAQFDLEVLQPKSRISLPLGREGLHLFGDRARLDGQPVQIDWSDEGTALVLEIEKAGRHQLELAFQPSLRTVGATTGFETAIPRIPRAKFKVVAPLGTEGLDSPRAFGATTTFAETGEFAFDLGATGALSLRWPSQSADSVKSAELEAEQLLWLKARPGSVVLEGRFRFTQSAGELRSVSLTTDPRLKMLPPRADQPVAAYRLQEGEPQKIHFELKPPFGKEAVLHLSFLVSGTTGVGNLVLPRLETVCDRVSRRWLAVSIDANLEADLAAPPAGATSAETAVSEFMSAWGKSTTPPGVGEPQAVYRFPRGETSWSVSARPKQPSTQGEALLDVSFGRDEAHLQWEADLATTGGTTWQHRLRIPATLEIESVALKQGMVERVARWSRPTREQAVVFLGTPVSGAQRLVVRGTISKPARGEWEVPHLSLHDSSVATQKIRLYRRPDVRIRLTSAPGFTADDPSQLGAYRESFGRLAESLVANQEAGAAPAAVPRPLGKSLATVASAANRPETQCRLVTAMLRKSGLWEAEVECQLGIDAGLVDVLRFDVPEEWSGPYTVEPAAEIRVLALSGQSRVRLEVRPHTPLSGDQVVRLRGPLSTAPQGRVSAPDVRPLELSKVERFLVVPAQVEAQQIAWETSGLQAAPLPLEHRTRYPASESFSAYQVVGTSFRAAIKHVERVSGVPLVRLADIHVAWRASGECHGVALFDLEPAGLRDCRLELPPQLELVGATVAGLPGLVTSEGSHTWRLQLGPDQLPQRLAVVFRGGVPHEESPPRKLRFAAPALKGLRVEQTLWTIHEPTGVELGSPVEPGKIDAMRLELLRYQTRSSLVAWGADLVSESSQRETADWYASWGEQQAASRRALDALRLAAGEPQFAAAEIAAIDRQQASLAERLAPGLADGSHVNPATNEDRLFDLNLPGRSQAAQFQFGGWQDAVEISYAGPAAGDLVTRLAASAGLLGIALLVYLLAKRGILAECLSRWPYACGVALGLGWWLWLAPSPLGWLLVAVSVLGAFRSPWKAARPRADPLSSLTPAPRRIAR